MKKCFFVFFLSFVALNLWAQNDRITVKGVVISADDDMPLPGVEISEKGEGNGTSTDFDGEFEFQVNEEAILIVSSLGYEDKEVALEGRNEIEIVLESASSELDEVVIVGYGKQKKQNLTSAVSSIKSETMESRATPTVTNMIQGAAPGLSVTRSSGQVGSQGLNVEIRGATSASGNVNPLVVIDGVKSSMSRFNALDPNDIDDITVLKDGGATAIYGAKSAGGVLEVTTKKGEKGKMKVSLSNNTSMQRPSNMPRRLSLLDEMDYVNLARHNAGLDPEYTEEDIKNAKEGNEFVEDPTNGKWKTYNQKDIIDQFVRDEYMMVKNNAQISGGSDKITYRASVGNMQQNGLFKVGDDKFSRWNGNLSLSADVNDYLDVDFSSSYTSQAFDKPQDGGWGLEGGGNSIFRQMYSSRMRYPIYNPDGTYYKDGTSSAYGYALLKEGGFNTSRDENFSFNVKGTVSNIVKGLELKLIYGREIDRNKDKNFKRTVDYYSGPGEQFLEQQNNPNNYSVTDMKQWRENFQAILDYSLSLEDHNFHIMGGYQWEDYRNESLTGTTKALFVNESPSLNFSSDPINESNSESVSSEAMQSYFGRLTYDYDEKYLFEATVRADESSRLAPDNRMKVFPSFSAGWDISKENWMESLDFLNQLKPRVSWGKVGSDVGIGYYDFIPQLATGSNLILGDNKETTYANQNALPATTIGWETVETRNIGLDFSLFENKLMGSFDYYNKYNNNMLVPLTLPSTIGVSVPKQNGGKLKTQGWELSLTYNDQIGDDFNYSITANLSDNTNKLLKYDGTSNEVNEGVNSLIEGQALNTIWGYESDGYFQSDDELDDAPSYEQILNQSGVPGKGDVRYVDRNGDGEISSGENTVEDHGDLKKLGDTNPRYQYGVNVAMDYKNFDFSFFIQGIGKRKFKPSNELIQPQLQAWYLPMDFQMDYWTEDNPNAQFPRPYHAGDQNFVSSDKWFVNGAYARLKNIQLGYTLPEKVIDNTPLSRLRVYFSGEDLLTISGMPKAFRGVIDPEAPNNTVGNYPFAKTFSVGIDIDF